MISKPRINLFKTEMERYFDKSTQSIVYASPCSIRYFCLICNSPPDDAATNVSKQGWLVENRNATSNHELFVGEVGWVDRADFDDRFTFAGMDVGEAMSALRNDHFVRRVDWDGEEALSVEDDCTTGRLPWIIHHSKRGAQPWTPTQSDILADDWMLV